MAPLTSLQVFGHFMAMMEAVIREAKDADKFEFDGIKTAAGCEQIKLTRSQASPLTDAFC